MTDVNEEVTQWIGRDVVDLHGEKIGNIADIRLGDKTLGLTWLVVKTGLFGGRKLLVPAHGARLSGDRVLVPFDKDRIKHVPEPGNREVLFRNDEQQLCNYYGLDYASSPAEPVEGCVERKEETGSPGAGL